MAMTSDTRQAVKERKILQSESRWLQKALFALAKAQDDHAKLAETGDAEPLMVTIDGNSFVIEAVTDAVREAVMERVEDLRPQVGTTHGARG